MVLVTLPEYNLFNFNDFAILAFAWRLGEHFLASWDVLWRSWIDRVVILVTRIPCRARAQVITSILATWGTDPTFAGYLVFLRATWSVSGHIQELSVGSVTTTDLALLGGIAVKTLSCNSGGNWRCWGRHNWSWGWWHVGRGCWLIQDGGCCPGSFRWGRGNWLRSACEDRLRWGHRYTGLGYLGRVRDGTWSARKWIGVHLHWWLYLYTRIRWGLLLLPLLIGLKTSLLRGLVGLVLWGVLVLNQVCKQSTWRSCCSNLQLFRETTLDLVIEWW